MYDINKVFYNFVFMVIYIQLSPPPPPKGDGAGMYPLPAPAQLGRVDVPEGTQRVCPPSQQSWEGGRPRLNILEAGRIFRQKIQREKSRKWPRSKGAMK